MLETVSYFSQFFRLLLGVSLSGSLLLCPLAVQAESVSVAVAANFTGPMKELAARFKQKSGHDLKLTFGASGKFYAQIKQGAPFQVFLSADQEKPLRLEQEKQTIPGSRFTYAQGSLVLWSSKPGLVDAKGQVLKQGSFKHLAVANPKLAPYGVAAIDVLTRMGLKQSLQSRFVQGENIAQTYQFVASGNAELGFIAYSQVIKTNPPQGSIWVIPQSFYRPIRQDAVLLNKAKNSAAAREFMAYLKSKPAREIIKGYGYQL